MTSALLIYVLILMLAAYALGGIPFGLIFSKAKGTDVRQEGSGNIGTTNVTREVGAGAGVATLICDVAKGFVATWFASWFLTNAVLGGDPSLVAPTGEYGWTIALVFLASICGHVFSPYLKFKGGKGIAVGFGAALGFAWPVALGLLVIFFLCVVPSRYVSAGSLCAALCLPFLTFFIYYPVTFAFEAPFILVAIIVFWAHRQNLKNLREGTERKFGVASKADGEFHQVNEEVIAAQAGAEEALSTGDDRPVKAAEKARRAAVADAAAVSSDDSVAAVEEATEEAGEADAATMPAPGTGVLFGDEEIVTRHIKKSIAKEPDVAGEESQVESDIESAEGKSEK